MYKHKNQTLFQEADPGADGTSANTQALDTHQHTTDAKMTSPKEATEFLRAPRQKTSANRRAPRRSREVRGSREETAITTTTY